MLVRKEDRWEVLAPGLSGYVLQTNGPNELPSWVQPSGGGGSVGRLWFTGTIINYTRLAPTYGMPLKPSIPFKLNSIYVAAQFARTYTLRAELWAATGTTLDSKISQSFDVVQPLDIHEVVRLRFPTPFELQAGIEYFVIVTGSDDLNGDKFQATYGAGGDTQRPWNGAALAYYSASLPAPGLALSSDGAGAYFWALEWE